MKGIFRHWKVLSFIFIIIIISQIVHAEDQDQTQRKKQVYFELFGNGIAYSINFEYKFSKNMLVRVGFEPLYDKDHWDYLGLFTVGGVFRERRLKFEYGVGFMHGTLIEAFSDSDRLLAFSGIFGLRWEFQKVVLRLVFTPLWLPDEPFLISMGFSLGARF